MPERCFLALSLSRPVVASLERAQASFIAATPGWAGEKWVSGGLLHVTLEFLGPMDEQGTDTLVRHMEAVAAGTPGFDIRLKGVEAVPSTRHASMLWASLRDPAGTVTGLRERLLAATARPCEPARLFRPHITLVRARRPRPVPPDALNATQRIVSEAGKGTDGIMSVRSVTLFSSTLTAAGPEYRMIAIGMLAR